MNMTIRNGSKTGVEPAEMLRPREYELMARWVYQGSFDSMIGSGLFKIDSEVLDDLQRFLSLLHCQFKDNGAFPLRFRKPVEQAGSVQVCLLYTSDAADDL